MSAALRLSTLGFHVDVYEKNQKPGGKAGEIQKDCFRFDRGPSLLTMPFILEELFSYCNENINDHLKIQKLDLLCKYFYPDNSFIYAWSDLDKFSEEIEVKTDDRASALKNYLSYCKKIYELTSDIFLYSNPYRLSSYINVKAIRTLFNIRKIDPFRTMDSANRSFFRDEKLIQLFNRYATYNGSDPYSCPATLNLISHVEYNLGGYYIEGGMYTLTKSLFKLALNKGVKFHFNTPVTQIITEGNKVVGVKTPHTTERYDCIISNVGSYNTKLLTGLKPETNKQLSSSALVFYWGVNVTSENLDIHNILFSADYRNEFRQIFKEKIYPDDPTVYIYISSKFNPSDAPSGYENWFAMINAPETNPALRHEVSIRQIIINKIKKMTGYDIEKLIVAEELMNPYDLENLTGSYRGAIYGISSNKKRYAFMRQPNKSWKFKGLYYCGGSSHPGGGIPLVILSGKNAAEEVIRDYS